MMDFLESQTSQVLAKALDGAAMQNQAIASNIANAETPGYKALNVDFENTLKDAIDEAEAFKNGTLTQAATPSGSLETTDPRHINPKPFTSLLTDSGVDISRTTFEFKSTGAAVDIEQQMAMLARNAQKYQAISKLESGNYTLLKNIIKSGG